MFFQQHQSTNQSCFPSISERPFIFINWSKKHCLTLYELKYEYLNFLSISGQ